ncbi:hypothetical protein JCM10212_004395 [Sporobolomyces blumeae]
MSSTSRRTLDDPSSPIPPLMDPVLAEPPETALVLPTSSSRDQDESLSTAARLLRQHVPVAFPTETVYGLGASALSSVAVKRIFAAKGRPSDNPLIVHVSSRDMLERLLPREPVEHEHEDEDEGTGSNQDDARRPTRCVGINPMYSALMDRFWPGPLSLVFSLSLSRPSSSSSSSSNPTRSDQRQQHPLDPPLLEVVPEVTNRLPSLCVRMPSHPLARALIERSGLPLAAPSANLSSRPSPTSALHVVNDLGRGRGVGAVLDGGECQVGVESTVVDYVEPEPGEEEEDLNDGQGRERARGTKLGTVRVLRAGGVSAEDIEACLRDAGFATSSTTPSSDPSSSTAKGGAGGGFVQVYHRDFKSSKLESAPTTPGMKYKHYSPHNSKVVLVRPLAKELDRDGQWSFLPRLQDLVQLSALTRGRDSVPSQGAQGGEAGQGQGVKFRVGLMLTDETLERLDPERVALPPPPPPLASPAPSNADAYPPHLSLVRLPVPPPSLFSQLSPNEDSNLPSLDAIETWSFSIGSRARPEEAGKRLFAGLRWFDQMKPTTSTTTTTATEEVKAGEAQETREGVDLILIEAVEEKGVGLAVMERARKAAGGGTGGEMQFAI